MTSLFTTLGIASIRKGRLRIRRRWWAIKRMYQHLHSLMIRSIKNRRRAV